MSSLGTGCIQFITTVSYSVQYKAKSNGLQLAPARLDLLRRTLSRPAAREHCRQPQSSRLDSSDDPQPPFVVDDHLPFPRSTNHALITSLFRPLTAPIDAQASLAQSRCVDDSFSWLGLRGVGEDSARELVARSSDSSAWTRDISLRPRASEGRLSRSASWWIEQCAAWAARALQAGQLARLGEMRVKGCGGRASRNSLADS